MKKEATFIILAGILWGSISIFVKNLSALGFESIEIVGLRVWFSAITVFVFLLVKNYKLLIINFRDLWLFFGTGVLSIVFFNYCYFRAINESSVSVAALLLYTAPAIVMILSIPILHEKITKRKICSLIIVCLGLMFVTGVLSSGDRISLKAIFIGLGSGFGYSLYSIFGKFLVKKYNSYTITAYTFIVASIGILPFISSISIAKRMMDTKVLFYSLGIAIFCTVLPFFFYTIGLEKIESGKASIIATVEPLVATLIGIVIYKENISISKIIGIVLIFLSIVILNINVKNISKMKSNYIEK